MKRFSIVPFLLVMALLAGCAPASPAGPAPGSANAPGTTTSVTPTPSTPATPVTPTVGAEVRVYFCLGEKVQPALRRAPAGSTALLKAALTELLAGPTVDEKASGLLTVIPKDTKLNGVAISGTVATVDLTSAFASGGGTLSMANRLAQVVFTATQFPGVTGVKFKLDGKPVTVFSGEGIILDHPQKRSDYEAATPAISVDDPAWSATLRSGDRAKGTANVFEAVFRLQLRDSAGKLLVDATVHASSGTGTRGTWSQKLTWSGAKAGTGTLRVFAASPKDGKPVDVLTIPITIAP